MVNIEVLNLNTGKIKVFSSLTECANHIGVSYDVLYRSIKNQTVLKNKWKVKKTKTNSIKKPDEIKLKRKNKYNEWNLTRLKEFPLIIIVETPLPFFDENAFETIKKATYNCYGKKKCSVWIDNENTSNNNFVRTKSRLQILIKTDEPQPFSYVYDFLDKMSVLIRELKNMNDERYEE